MMDVFLTWWPILLVIVQCILAWVLWSMRQQFVTHDAFEAFKETHTKAHDGITADFAEGRRMFSEITTELKHLPTRRDIEDLKETLHTVDKGVIRMSGHIREVAARLGAVEKPVDQLMGRALDGDN
ncbi:MAG: hypothetical protein Q7R40_06500 [Phaeospirillum sp.]|nr:hypothetical protein [Phaeospirillum sp.]